MSGLLLAILSAVEVCNLLRRSSDEAAVLPMLLLKAAIDLADDAIDIDRAGGGMSQSETSAANTATSTAAAVDLRILLA